MSSRAEHGLGHSAAWRLALPGIAVLALGTAAVMATGYALLADSIRTRGDAWLVAEVESLAERVQVTGMSLTPNELELEVRELELHEGVGPHDGDEDDEGLFFLTVLAPGGRTSASAVRGSRSALGDVLAAVPTNRDATSWVHPVGWEYPVRVVRRTLDDGREVLGGATPYADAELLEEVRDVAAIGLLVMLAVGVPAVWFEVRRTLRRVDELTIVASTISADALATRLPERDVATGGDEIDRLAATLNALLDRAAGAVDELRTVADTMAHDLRTPLTALRGTLEEVLSDSDPSRARAAVEAAIGEVDDLSSLVSATLDIAEAEAGALRLKRRPVDLAAVVRDLVDLYEPAASDQGLELQVVADGPLQVAADEALVKRLLINLLDNAMAHLPAGARVTITAGIVGDIAEVVVADDGPGIPVQIRERAFEPRVRGPASRGRGLGLALVRAVAVAHGGRVTLEQPPGGGSSIRVVLPRNMNTLSSS